MKASAHYYVKTAAKLSWEYSRMLQNYRNNPAWHKERYIPYLISKLNPAEVGRRRIKLVALTSAVL